MHVAKSPGLQGGDETLYSGGWLGCLMIENHGDFHCLAPAPSPFMYFCPEVLTVAEKHTAVSVRSISDKKQAQIWGQLVAS